LIQGEGQKRAEGREGGREGTDTYLLDRIALLASISLVRQTKCSTIHSEGREGRREGGREGTDTYLLDRIALLAPIPLVRQTELLHNSLGRE